MSLKRLLVTGSGGCEYYVQVDSEGIALAQVCDRLQAELAAAVAERDTLRRELGRETGGAHE